MSLRSRTSHCASSWPYSAKCSGSDRTAQQCRRSSRIAARMYYKHSVTHWSQATSFASPAPKQTSADCVQHRLRRGIGPPLAKSDALEQHEGAFGHTPLSPRWGLVLIRGPVCSTARRSAQRTQSPVQPSMHRRGGEKRFRPPRDWLRGIRELVPKAQSPAECAPILPRPQCRLLFRCSGSASRRRFETKAPKRHRGQPPRGADTA